MPSNANNDAPESSVKQKVVEAMRANAESGAYAKFPPFAELCATGQYDPEVARSLLAHHAGDPVVRHLLVAIDNHSALWHSRLKSVEPDLGGPDGPTYILMAPEMMDGPYLVTVARHIADVIDRNVQGPFRLADKLRAALGIMDEGEAP